MEDEALSNGRKAVTATVQKMRLTKRANAWATVGVLLMTSAIVGGCGKNEPPKEKIANAMAGVVPAHYKIAKGEVEFIPKDKMSGTAKVQLQISPKEDLYISATTDPNVLASAGKEYPQSQLNAPAHAADEAKVSFPRDLRDQIDVRVRARNHLIRKANQPWIKAAAKAGSTVTVYGTATATYEFKDWRVSNPRLDHDVSTLGAPRSAFPSDSLVVDSADAATLAEEISKASAALDKALADATDAVNRAMAEKRASEAEVVARKEAIEQERQKSILAAIAKGRRYEGRVGTQPLAIEFIECNPPGTLVRARIFNPKVSALTRLYTGTVIFDREKSRGYPIHLSAEQPVQGSNIPFIYRAHGGEGDILLGPTANGLEGRPTYYQGEPIVLAKANE